MEETIFPMWGGCEDSIQNTNKIPSTALNSLKSLANEKKKIQQKKTKLSSQDQWKISKQIWGKTGEGID